MPGWLAGVVRPGRNAPWSFPWKCSTFCWNVATPCSRSSWKRGATATTTPEERQAWPVVDCWARTYKSSYRPLRYFNKHVWIFAWGFFGWGGRNAKHFADREIIESALPAHKGCAMLAISRLGSFDYLLDWVRSHSIFCYYLFIPDFYGLFVFIFVVFLFFFISCVQVWCDWLLCHSSVWNPPPTSRDYHVGYDHLTKPPPLSQIFYFCTPHSYTHTHTARVVMNRPSTCHFSFDTFFHKLGNFF